MYLEQERFERSKEFNIYIFRKMRDGAHRNSRLAREELSAVFGIFSPALTREDHVFFKIAGVLLLPPG